MGSEVIVEEWLLLGRIFHWLLDILLGVSLIVVLWLWPGWQPMIIALAGRMFTRCLVASIALWMRLFVSNSVVLGYSIPGLIVTCCGRLSA